MRPVLFGEVLFDCFPDRRVLGGAPLNVAWHLKGLGLDPLLISRVGEDALGEEAVRAMAAFGLDTRGVQRDPYRPTGQVTVEVRGGEPAFAIPPGQAFDGIAAEELPPLPGEGLFYHGTLAMRAPASRRALEVLRGAGLPAFVDLNLRAPWWERAWVEEALSSARWAKLNREELCALGFDTPEALRERFGLELVALTLGEGGAALVTPEGRREGEAVPCALVDTVGAGDAFSAVLLKGLIRGWPAERMLDEALRFASRVCTLRGAVPSDRAFYSGSS